MRGVLKVGVQLLMVLTVGREQRRGVLVLLLLLLLQMLGVLSEQLLMADANGRTGGGVEQAGAFRRGGGSG